MEIGTNTGNEYSYGKWIPIWQMDTNNGNGCITPTYLLDRYDLHGPQNLSSQDKLLPEKRKKSILKYCVGQNSNNGSPQEKEDAFCHHSGMKRDSDVPKIQKSK